MHRAALRRGLHVYPGPIAEFVRAKAAAAAQAAAGLWRHDPSAWSADAAVQKSIANRLGWLTSPTLMAESIDRLHDTAREVASHGFTDVVLLGMGGSSLAPEVLRAIVGARPGAPRLHMLDSTDPAAIHAAHTEPQRTVYILASKSGSTIEPNSLAAYFRARLERAGIADWGSHFIAITDPDTSLHALARDQKFRHLFLNPSDIGGRYSALSFFGMVPAALMGQDVAEIVRWGQAMLEEAQTAGDVVENPALGLGLLMAAGALARRDKLTLVLPPDLEPFGLWVEQLVAESTGKHGAGIVPIAGEPLGDPHVYGDDRVFVRMRYEGEADERHRDAALQRLADAPHAVIEFAGPASLGAEFVRWEIATAIAGALIGVNPFDEPNVAQAKAATNTLLERYKSEGRLVVSAIDLETDYGATFTASTAAKSGPDAPDADGVLTLVRPGDYVAILAFLGPDPELHDALRRFRLSVRDHTHAATMFGYGPRYLHSTGQLHKGGPNTGVFILISSRPTEDLDIPGQHFSFATLELAQALGDFTSLDQTGRRAVHVHLPSPDRAILDDALGRVAQLMAG